MSPSRTSKTARLNMKGKTKSPSGSKATRNTRSMNRRALANGSPQDNGVQEDSSSDGGDYDEVDNISESDEDDPDVELAEERAILKSLANGSDEDDADDESNDDESPQPDDDDSEFEGFPDDDPGFFKDQIMSTKRRVRFEDEQSDSTSDNESVDNVFPDLLAEEDLDPGFRRQIRSDFDLDDGSETYAEWMTEDMPFNQTSDLTDPDEIKALVHDGTGSSDFDSDEEGQTTEEEPVIITNPKRIILQPRDEESSEDDEPSVNHTPRLGLFRTDGRTSYAVSDHSAQKLRVFIAPNARNQALNEVQESTPPPSRASLAVMEQMIASDPNSIMLSANFLGTSDNGFMMSPEAFVRPDYETGDSSESTTPQAQSEMLDFDVTEFLHVNHDTSEEENEEDPSSPNGIDGSPSTTKTSRRPTTASSQDVENSSYPDIHPFLDHLSKTGVAAFRQNQAHHRLLTRHAETRESIAFASPLHEGALRGVKHGRLNDVNVPITPVRKTKAHAMFDFRFDPSPSKRKHSSEVSTEFHGHKRSKSMI